MKKIVVIGSLNMDLVTEVNHLVKPGETLSATSFSALPGGKGANQAAAAGKLGADVHMVGKIGADDYGDELLKSLKQASVATDGIQIEKNGSPSGMAFIQVSSTGENSIVLVNGANNNFRPHDLDAIRGVIEQGEIIILQLEVPFETVVMAIDLAKELGKKVILNPAPARYLPGELLKKIDLIIPNEIELETLTGLPAKTENNIYTAANRLLASGAGKVIVTAGDRGCYCVGEGTREHIPSEKVKALDTTAAGDSFIGAVAAGLSEGLTERKAIDLAVKAAAVTVTRKGAQPSLPHRGEVEDYFS
ncbi:ribokinase [Salipaludibacillus aurantiacus]|uniref:Ribokinase n=1 Tax=Salipaludibacillus aurantiacus TaxID=1601833 RepID=A0A1H9SBW5_9BACI|nr:ribokinase [Salipaludibacillus aurantiacus]SER82451.1 ribokinase [Salipaludibacillus aurantiacus]